mgnify:CR=1 FL=1
MKKTLLAVITVGLLLPGNIFAETHTIGGTADDAKQSAYLGDKSGELFRVSTNVVLEINSTTADYAVTSGHLQGTKQYGTCLLYTSPSPRDRTRSRMPSSA